jgi:crossover junction endodeoxyribonuclease RuvC
LRTPPPNDIVLGVDPGLATTGWGVVEKNGTQLILRCFGAIETRSDLSLPQRLHQIQRELAQIIQAIRPHVVAIEELYFAKFAVSIAATAQARGVILWTAQEYGVPVVEYNPRAVKVALTGFGSASKIQMQSMVQRVFGLKSLPRPDDAADALAIALCHLQTNPMLKGASSKQPADSSETPLAARRSLLAGTL